MLFSTAAELYMEDKTKRLRANTIDGYRSALNRHVLPAFGGRELADITYDEVQEWVDGDSFAGIPGAAAKAFKTFRQVYRWTMRKLQLRIYDVTQGIVLPEYEACERRVLTASQERDMLRGIVGQEWEAVIILSASLGLRRCEACGVEWSDIDWRSGAVHIRRGLHWSGGHEYTSPCKTKLSKRMLFLPRFALERLREIRGSRRSGRVCELAPHQVAGRFKRFCRRYGLPWVSLTELRHSWATIALNSGAAIADVSVALGHTTVDTAIQHYLMSFSTVVKRATRSYEESMVELGDVA
jgi:integrase